MSKSSKFILGALLGAVAAVLLTPITGKNARKKVVQGAKKAGIDTTSIEEKVRSVTEKGNELLEEIQKTKGKRTARKREK